MSSQVPILVAAFLIALAPYHTSEAEKQPGARGPALPLEGTYWRADDLAGKPTPAERSSREAHLQFKGARVTGSDGCNRITGNYELRDEVVKFNGIIATRMACPDTADMERAFHAALNAAAGLKVAGDRLTLADSGGAPLARFVGARPPAK